MGGKPSRDDFKENQEFMNQVRKSQQEIIKGCEQNVNEFFQTVDVLLVGKGAIEAGKIDDLEQKNKDELKKAEDARKKAEETAGAGSAPPTPAPPPTTAKGDGKGIPEATVINHTPAPDVLWLLNQATVFYAESQQKDLGLVKALVDQLSKAVTGIAKGAAGAAAGAAGGPIGSAAMALFGTPEAVKGVVDGVTGCVNAVVSSLESNMTVSSSLQKKVQFIAPGCYCATYLTTSVFKFKGREGTLSYELKCGAIYVATSTKLMQIVTSLAMYRTISDSFQRQLAKMEETLGQFIEAIQDSAFFTVKFGFKEADYNTLISRLKTNVMKDVVDNFWSSLKDEDAKYRLDMWNEFVRAGDFRTTITTNKEAYNEAYEALRKYYQDFVLNPPMAH